MTEKKKNEQRDIKKSLSKRDDIIKELLSKQNEDEEESYKNLWDIGELVQK